MLVVSYIIIHRQVFYGYLSSAFVSRYPMLRRGKALEKQEVTCS